MIALILFFMILGLGLTLTFQDFLKVATPIKIGINLIVQYTTVPMIAFLLSSLIKDSNIATGVLIIGSAPSEITSALMVYLAKGNLALGTASMRSSILAAPFIMPLLLSIFAGESVSIDIMSISKEILLIVALPIIIGSFFRTKFQRLEKYEEQCSSLSSIMVILLIFIVASGNASIFLNLSMLWLALLLLILNLSGYIIGFIIGKMMKPKEEFRTYTFTIDMKEFGVGTAIALQLFGPEAAIPSSVYGIIMLITAPILVKVLRKWARNNF
ncbi:MAG: bile acid:sodium symporter family protein [Nitrososphaerales archaeon]